MSACFASTLFKYYTLQDVLFTTIAHTITWY